MSSVLVRAPAPLALMVLIFWLSSQSDPGADIGALGRIGAHAGEYFLLTILWAWALAAGLGRRAVPAAALIAFVYAISDEVHQGFVEGRDSSPFDVAVDAAGVALAVALLSVMSRRGPGARSRRTARRARARPA
ncbi:MAG: VanZ family protein [Solirubrobacterales bacterium]